MFWPFKKRGTKLYGFDLDKYSYLGYTKIEWGDAKAYIHGFVHKTNGRRHWHIDPGMYTFKPWDRHPYVMFAELWRVGEEGGGYNTLVRAILETAGLDEDAKKALIEALKDWYV